MIVHTCKYCNYTTNHKTAYDKHLLTQKHKKITILSKENEILIKDKNNFNGNIIISKIDNQNDKIDF
jgi:biotin synthase-related radical SAM superfamily protein